jgi:K+ transporter
MIALLQLSLPVIVILGFIVFKLNHEQKRWLFKVPIWISSTILSLGIGHFASGVMGFYGAAFCDLLLFPAMLLVKKLWLKKEKKLFKQKQAEGSVQLALPTRLRAALVR